VPSKCLALTFTLISLCCVCFQLSAVNRPCLATYSAAVFRRAERQFVLVSRVGRYSKSDARLHAGCASVAVQVSLLFLDLHFLFSTVYSWLGSIVGIFRVLQFHVISAGDLKAICQKAICSP